MLEIKDLYACAEETEILRGINLTVNAGEVHAIMGPNGSGKSTLAHVLAGREDYEVTHGEVLFQGKNLLEMEIDERAGEGVFLAYQYPVEISGISNKYFLKAALNSIRKYRGEKRCDTSEFLKLVKDTMKLLGMDKSLLDRGVNEGFSGGEKKRNEIFQMAVLQPKLAILDETDSGLDIDALRVVADGVNEVRNDRTGMGVLAITHYQRLLDLLRPDVVHILIDGQIVERGDSEIAERLEREGYEAFR